MRKLIIMLVLIFAVSMLSLPATCADCSVGGTVDHGCKAEGDDSWESCCMVYDCSNQQQGDYCYGQARADYRSCAMLHGCPNLAQ